jgi:DNA-binding PadR family transcriptional regulator
VPDTERPNRRDPSGTIGRNIEAFLLLDLLRESSYGYDLIRRLGDYGFRRAVEEPGVVYKVLRSLEDRGAILSEWTTRESGPARRYYHITSEGRVLLRHRAYQLKRYVDRAQRLLDAFVSFTGDDLSIESAPAVSDAADEASRSQEAEPAIAGSAAGN